MVKMFTVLVSIISNSQVFLLKNVSSSYFFSKTISVYAIFNHQSFNDMLTNDIISFEQLGRGASSPLNFPNNKYQTANCLKKKDMIKVKCQASSLRNHQMALYFL